MDWSKLLNGVTNQENCLGDMIKSKISVAVYGNSLYYSKKVEKCKD